MKRRPLSIDNNKDHRSSAFSSSSSASLSDESKSKTSGMVSRLAPARTGGKKHSTLAMTDIDTNGDDPQLPPPSDKFNYALLIVLYTLQGIPMGLSASIPFLLQEKIQKMTATAAAAADLGATASSTSAMVAAEAARASYNANAIFALCSWPFSLKLLWAPIVDALYFKRFGRRKSWLVPIQTLAGLIMVGGSDFVESQLGLGNVVDATAATGGAATASSTLASMNVRGVTAFFFVLYFLMATQDIAVDGWALTMLSKKNRGRGPICNSIGQNIGYFMSFVGFLALNDVESANKIWRPLLRLPQDPTKGLVSLRGFLRFMGSFMIVTTAVVAFFKREITDPKATAESNGENGENSENDDDDNELDASEIGVRETYHRLWTVSRLPAVRWLFLILVTYRLPVALSDNVKFLKAVEYGLSKSTTALLSPTLILPLGILVPLVASKIWHSVPLQQFMRAYEWRITIIPLLDIFMLRILKNRGSHNSSIFWAAVIASTAGQAITSSMQFNAQMTFFASRVDPAIGGSYMTLLNTMANLGGTWPASFVMKLLGWLTPDGSSSPSDSTSWFGGDPYEFVQLIFVVLGLLWIFFLGPVVRHLSTLPDDAWRTQISDGNDEKNLATSRVPDQHSNSGGGARKRLNAKNRTLSALESGLDISRWKQAKNDGKIE